MPFWRNRRVLFGRDPVPRSHRLVCPAILPLLQKQRAAALWDLRAAEGPSHEQQRGLGHGNCQQQRATAPAGPVAEDQGCHSGGSCEQQSTSPHRTCHQQRATVPMGPMSIRRPLSMWHAPAAEGHWCQETHDSREPSALLQL